jgi:hypothetical protein
MNQTLLITLKLKDYHGQGTWCGWTTIELLKKIFNAKPNGVRRVGRPRLRWEVGVDRDIRTLEVKNWKKLALDRDGWAKLLRRRGPTKGCRANDDDDDDDGDDLLSQNKHMEVKYKIVWWRFRLSSLTSCQLVNIYRRFGGSCCILQGLSSTWIFPRFTLTVRNGKPQNVFISKLTRNARLMIYCNFLNKIFRE